MDIDKSLQVRKEGVFTKFLNFFRNLFKTKKAPQGYTEKNIILQKERVQNIITPVEKKEFKDGIKINAKNEETIKLQKQFEADANSADNMSEEQINSLILLYKEQVSALTEKINNKRIELEKTMNRLNNYSTNA